MDEARVDDSEEEGNGQRTKTEDSVDFRGKGCNIPLTHP